MCCDGQFDQGPSLFVNLFGAVCINEFGLSQNSFVPQTVYCWGSQFSLREVSGLVQMVVSGSLDVPNSFVSPYNDSFVSFVSQSGWWCPALWMSRIHLFPQKKDSFVSFVSQSGWWFPALWMSQIHLSPHITIHLSHLSPSLAGGVRLAECMQTCN